MAAKKLPAVKVKHTRERGHAITYELRHVLCGKGKCSKLHGPYWYAYWTAGGRVRTAYIGKKFQRVEDKARDKLLLGGQGFTVSEKPASKSAR